MDGDVQVLVTLKVENEGLKQALAAKEDCKCRLFFNNLMTAGNFLLSGGNLVVSDIIQTTGNDTLDTGTTLTNDITAGSGNILSFTEPKSEQQLNLDNRRFNINLQSGICFVIYCFVLSNITHYKNMEPNCDQQLREK